MVREISTAVSDGVLALATFHASHQVFGESLLAAIGFAVTGAAATCGMFKFGSANASADLVDKHAFLTWLTKACGLSFIAASYFRREGYFTFANLLVACSLALVASNLGGLLQSRLEHQVTELVSTAAMGSLLLLSIYVVNPYSIMGCILFAVAGLAVGATGNIYGVPRVDIFHYVLTIGIVALMMGLVQQPSPVYYKKSS